MFRFGVAESHGRGAALQLNTFLNDGAVTYNNGSGKYEVKKLHTLLDSGYTMITD